MRRMRLVRATTAAALGWLLMVGSVFGSSGGASVNHVLSTAPTGILLHWYGDFSAGWTVTKFNVDGTNVWHVTNIQMTDLVELGKTCGSDNCDTWYPGASVKFLNSSGNQVGLTINGTRSIAGTCHEVAYSSQSLFWGWCRTAYDAPYSATKVKVTWTVGLDFVNGASGTIFNITKTVPLY